MGGKNVIIDGDSVICRLLLMRGVEKMDVLAYSLRFQSTVKNCTVLDFYWIYFYFWNFVLFIFQIYLVSYFRKVIITRIRKLIRHGKDRSERKRRWILGLARFVFAPPRKLICPSLDQFFFILKPILPPLRLKSGSMILGSLILGEFLGKKKSGSMQIDMVLHEPRS